MTDGEYLKQVAGIMSGWWRQQRPIPPSSVEVIIDGIERQLGNLGTRTHVPIFQQTQEFWRCKHYPSAIDNYYGLSVSHGGVPYLLTRTGCDLGCSEAPTWHSNGMMTERRETPPECKPAT
jgi:hypothetical protein